MVARNLPNVGARSDCSRCFNRGAASDTLRTRGSPVARNGATMSNVWQAVLAVIAILDRTRAGDGKSSRA